jgi:hypothetical protein
MQDDGQWKTLEQGRSHDRPRVTLRGALTATAAGALAAVALMATACGSSTSTQASSATTTTAASQGTVDPAQVEKGIEESLSTATVKITSAKCPSNVQAAVGATFTCDVTMSNGGTGKATVTQTGINNFKYALEPGSVQIPGSTADAAIEKSLAARGVPNATVKCPQNIIVKVGTYVTCNVSGPEGVAHGTVTYTFSEENGTVDPASVKTS